MELAEIQKKYPEKEKICRSLIKNEKIAKVMVKLEGEAGITILEEDLKNKIEIINHKLLFEVELCEIERKILLRERDCWEWLFNIFDENKQRLGTLNKFKEKYD